MKFANIEWRNNQPYSLDFNDVYFNSDHGLQETDAVFIAQNNLAARFASLQKNQTFTIIETGFGSGLNFFAVASCWQQYAPNDASLYYISIEKYPLSIEDFTQCAQIWPAFSSFFHSILPQYLHLKLGLNMLRGYTDDAESRILLALWACPIDVALASMTQKADAWLLDGFAPAKNAEMWSSEVFTHIARLSQTGTTFATFTSAGIVRRGLQAVGFNVKKQTGFGKKREMLSGVFN